MHSIKYTSYKQFKTRFKLDLLNESGKDSLESFLFRGQADSNWHLISSFDRREKDKSKYNELIDEFVGICERYDFNEDLISSARNDKNVIAAFAQHYGLPTRLLDWTMSYYFAAFFAFSEVDSNRNGECSIWAINRDSELEKKSQGLHFIKLSSHKFNYRIKNQLGHFTLSAHTEDSIDEYESNVNSNHGIDDLIWKFDIKYRKEDISNILSDLNDMGITYSIVYPDLEGYIKEAMHNLKIVR